MNDTGEPQARALDAEGHSFVVPHGKKFGIGDEAGVDAGQSEFGGAEAGFRSPAWGGGLAAIRGKSDVAKHTSFLLLIPPPILYATFFGAGLAVDQLVPWHPAWMESAAARGLAWLLVAAAVGLGLSSLCLFWVHSTTVIPHGQPARLITGGPFAVSRNPIYLALTVGYCGAAVLCVCAWPLVLLAGPLIHVRLVVIPFEERRMLAAFGQAYADYCRRVRRWL